MLKDTMRGIYQNNFYIVQFSRRDGDSVNACTWKLKAVDGSTSEFHDLRRKVGNQIHRSYLLKSVFDQNKIDKMKASLRGPKDEFKDFDDFVVISAKQSEQDVRILVEANVYENLRIVGTDSMQFAENNPETIVDVFTSILTDIENHNTRLLLSESTRVQVK